MQEFTFKWTLLHFDTYIYILTSFFQFIDILHFSYIDFKIVLE